jgi:hypothetical protein
MSETPVQYKVLQTSCNPDTMEHEQPSAPLDLLQIERMLLPLLNYVRKAQGKKPVIVPKG